MGCSGQVLVILSYEAITFDIGGDVEVGSENTPLANGAVHEEEDGLSLMGSVSVWWLTGSLRTQAFWM